MDNKVINKLTLIQENIKRLSIDNFLIPKVICVSKTFHIDKLKPLIDHGHYDFGENKVQEAILKWSKIKKDKLNLKLHMIGKLQTNKAKKAVELFDYIHSLDTTKLANALKKGENEFNKKLKYFIQINIGNEEKKSGIKKNEAKNFLSYCQKELDLDIIGLMIIPPNDGNTKKYFKEISELNSDLGLEHLSMGMSEDYELAIKFNSTFLRIGSAILGPRTVNE